LFSADELARIQDAANGVNAEVAPYGVSVTETTDPTLANIMVDDFRVGDVFRGPVVRAFVRR
jgi:hypothetical protein